MMKKPTSCGWSTLNENLTHFPPKARRLFSTRQDKEYMIKCESGIGEQNLFPRRDERRHEGTQINVRGFVCHPVREITREGESKIPPGSSHRRKNGPGDI